MKSITIVYSPERLILVSSSVFAQFTQSQMVAEWQRANYTPQKPTCMLCPKMVTVLNQRRRSARSFAQQMLHLADANYVFATIASNKPNPVGETLASHNVNEKQCLRRRKLPLKW